MPYSSPSILPTHHESPNYVHGAGYEAGTYNTPLTGDHPYPRAMHPGYRTESPQSPIRLTLTRHAHKHQYRNSYLESPSKYWKDHFVAATGEFVGTFLFLFLAFAGHLMAVEQAQYTRMDGTNDSQTVIFISLSYGFALLVTAWSFYRISGGLFNPAVTLGMILSAQLPLLRGVLLIPVQIIGAIAAAALVSALFPGDISDVFTTLGPLTTKVQGLFIECFLTAVLVFTVLMLAAEKSKDTFIAPVGIGLALFISEIAGVSYTGASLNPARSFGPCVADLSFPNYHWIYWAGPVLGAALAAGYYRFVKWANHGNIAEANPGQDGDGTEEFGKAA